MTQLHEENTIWGSCLLESSKLSINWSLLLNFRNDFILIWEGRSAPGFSALYVVLSSAVFLMLVCACFVQHAVGKMSRWLSTSNVSLVCITVNWSAAAVRIITCWCLQLGREGLPSATGSGDYPPSPLSVLQADVISAKMPTEELAAGQTAAEGECLCLQGHNCSKNHGECDRVCRFRSSHPGNRSSSVLLLPTRSRPTLLESTGSPPVPASPGLPSAPWTPQQCLRSRWPCRTCGRTGSLWFQPGQSCPGSPPPVTR